eukprot:3136856-Pleurochrysis_carterae.AAC.5
MSDEARGHARVTKASLGARGRLGSAEASFASFQFRWPCNARVRPRRVLQPRAENEPYGALWTRRTQAGRFAAV